MKNVGLLVALVLTGTMANTVPASAQQVRELHWDESGGRYCISMVAQGPGLGKDGDLKAWFEIGIGLTGSDPNVRNTGPRRLLDIDSGQGVHFCPIRVTRRMGIHFRGFVSSLGKTVHTEWQQFIVPDSYRPPNHSEKFPACVDSKAGDCW